jgi:hypothetical protein
MAQPKPKVGDIWRAHPSGLHFLVVEKYLDKQHNTHMLTMQNIEHGHLFTNSAVSVRAKWEFMG